MAPSRDNMSEADLRVKTIKRIVFAVVGLVAALYVVCSLFENLDAGELMIVQDPWDGELHCHVTSGVKPQTFGTVTKYNLRSQYWFSAHPDQGSNADQSIKIRFNDGGHATISGSLAWEMPIDCSHLTALHRKYGSQNAVEQQVVRTVAEKAVYMTGPLMSSKESYAERRSDLLRYIEDQIAHGIYRTETHETKEPDPMTGVLKTVKVVHLVERDGNIMRQDASPVEEFGIRTSNLSINSIPYDKIVEAQIAAQQQAIMEVQTAMAQAKKAEQAAITAEKSGQAEAAKAKWTQEVLKAKAVTEAQQKLEVAVLDRQAAEQSKQREILLGEGEARRRQLVMAADGALEKKLATYERVNAVYAAALKDVKGPLVPTVQMGGGTTTAGGNPVLDLMHLLQVKTARDLALDVTGNK